MFRFWIQVFFSCILSLSVSAQSDWSYAFEKAKQVFADGKYTLAMEMFLPVTTPDETNPYASYAQYYYGLAAYKSAKYQESRQMLLQLLNRDPNWEQHKEAEFVLAASYWELKKFRSALAYMYPLQSDMSTSVKEMQSNYYKTIEPLDTLIQLQRAYPKDIELASILYTKIKNTSDVKLSMLAAYLQQEYKFTTGSSPSSYSKKSSYKVAVLLPFNIKELTYEVQKNANSYILELYQGIRLAADSLAKMGVSLSIHPYDTRTDNETIKKIIALPELKSMDLIIGPLVPYHIEVVTAFSEANKIPVINPISLNSKLTEKTNYTLLFQPVLETYAGTVAQFAYENFRFRKNVDKDNSALEKKQVLIFYSGEKKDSLLAFYYKDSIQKKGFKVTICSKVSNRTIGTVAPKVFGDSISLLKTSHIFVASSDPTVASYIISQVEISKQQVPLVVKSDWLDFNITYDQYERRMVYFMHPDYYAFYSDSYKNFLRHYLTAYKTMPTRFSHCGFELLFQAGSRLHQYGSGFLQEWCNQGSDSGAVLIGANFSNHKYNTYLPLVYFQQIQLILANPIQ